MQAYSIFNLNNQLISVLYGKGTIERQLTEWFKLNPSIKLVRVARLGNCPSARNKIWTNPNQQKVESRSGIASATLNHLVYICVLDEIFRAIELHCERIAEDLLDRLQSETGHSAIPYAKDLQNAVKSFYHHCRSQALWYIPDTWPAGQDPVMLPYLGYSRDGLLSLNESISIIQRDYLEAQPEEYRVGYREGLERFTKNPELTLTGKQEHSDLNHVGFSDGWIDSKIDVKNGFSRFADVRIPERTEYELCDQLLKACGVGDIL